jgi:hypothetical protein
LLLFLAERYLPQPSEQTARVDAQQARAASEQLAREGTDVRHLDSMLVPADEICFAMFEAQSAEQVQLLIERAAIPYEHIVQAVRIDGEHER